MNATLTADSQRFLKEIFGDDLSGVMLTGGREYSRPRHVGDASLDLVNQEAYYSCARFRATARNRQTGNVERVMVVVIDDIGSKISLDDFELGGTEPSFMVETSAGNFHAGYIIEGGCTVEEYEQLRASMNTHPVWGKADGNTDPVHWWRLPQGVVTKPDKAGFVTRLVSGTWEKRSLAWLQERLGGLSAGTVHPRTSDERAWADTADMSPDEDLPEAFWQKLKVSAAWDVWTKGVGKTRSENVFHLAMAMRKAGFSGSEFWAVVLVWDLAGPENTDERQVRRAWSRARSAYGAESAKEAFKLTGAPADVRGLPKALQLQYALDVAAQHGENIRYVLDRRAWALFEGGVWNHLSSGVKLAGQYAMAMARRAPPRDKGEHDVTTASFMAGVEELCRQIPALQCRETDFDTDPWVLGTPKGTVDLKTGALRPARGLDMISKCCAVTPLDEAVCPHWLRFMDEVTRGDKESVLFLQQVIGYALTGLTIEEKILFLYGPGGNGKSKFADLLAWMMGDYFAKPVADLFIKKAMGMGHTSKLAMLAGARLCTISEVPAGAQWDEGLLKDITGGGLMTASFKHKDEFSFEPRFMLLAYGNHQPTFPGGIDDAIRRRFMMMEFKFKPVVPDLGLLDKLKKEGPGILRWAIDGCLSWQKMGLLIPGRVRATTDAMFAEQDLMGRWIEEHVERVKGSTETATKMFEDWNGWCSQQGEHPTMTQTAFAREMTERREFTKKRDMVNTKYLDVRLVKEKAARFS